MSQTSFRVANFNIKHAATREGYLGRPGRLAAACAELDVDILALQEVERYVWRSWFADLFTKAAGDTYSGSYFSKAMGAHLIGAINPFGQYGNALLVKGEILSHKEIPLKGDYIRLRQGNKRNVAREPRIATFADVQLEQGQRLSVSNTHIGGLLKEQYVGTIATELGNMPGPWAAFGDFNAGRPNMIKWLAAVSSLQLVPRPPELAEGYKQSDHIAIEGLDCISVSAQWLNLSDHPVITAELGVPVAA